MKIVCSEPAGPQDAMALSTSEVRRWVGIPDPVTGRWLRGFAIAVFVALGAVVCATGHATGAVSKGGGAGGASATSPGVDP